MFNFESKKSEEQGAVGGNNMETMKPISFELFDRDNVELEQISKIKNGATHVDYFSDKRIDDEEVFLNAGPKTYKISAIDERSKYTDKLRDCTSVIAVGVNKSTGKNISFISHQDPENILKNKDVQNKFIQDLNTRLDEFVSLCDSETVDINILGGNKNINYKEQMSAVDFDKISPQEAYSFYDYQEFGPYERYRRSIKFLNKIIFGKLHKYPFVVLGPNANIKSIDEDFYHNNDTDVYLDTSSRKLYAVRKKNDVVYDLGFSGDEVEEMIKKYK